MEVPSYHSILSQPLSFWAANSNEKNIPELIRCSGISPVADVEQITFFIPEKFSKVFIANTQSNPNLSLLGASLNTFESYQYKGIFTSFRLCTEEEVGMQHQYVGIFADTLRQVGFNWERLLVFSAFFHQPSFAVTFGVQEIFEQTPRKGTGNLVNK